MSTSDSDTDRVTAARRIADEVSRRAAYHEAVGAVRGLTEVGLDEARGPFFIPPGGVRPCEVEVARVTAILDEAADGRADPDWRD